MGLMALMASALPPTQMAALPSIVEASTKTAISPTKVGQPTHPGAIGNGGSAPGQESSNNNNGNTLVKFPANGSRQSLTTNTVLERSPSSGSQILVPSALKSSLAKQTSMGEGQGATGVSGMVPSFQPLTSSTPLLSVVSNNGKKLQPESGETTKSKISTTASLMLTFEGESSNPSSVTPGFNYVSPATMTATTSSTIHESARNFDGYDPEEDIMYRV
jgi:hypothetical protein